MRPAGGDVPLDDHPVSAFGQVQGAQVAGKTAFAIRQVFRLFIGRRPPHRGGAAEEGDVIGQRLLRLEMLPRLSRRAEWENTK